MKDDWKIIYMSDTNEAPNRTKCQLAGCWPVLVLQTSVRRIQSREFSRGRRTILLLPLVAP
jgi:hypothetical protein